MTQVGSDNQSQFDLPNPVHVHGSGSQSSNVTSTDPKAGNSQDTKSNQPVNTPILQPASGDNSSSVVHAPNSQNSGQDPISAIPTPLVAEDSDLIEQEWVEKAKAIVEHTKDDPFKQNEEVNKIKADYIKKRYQKDIKLSDE